MFAELPITKKIPHILPIVPVYLVIITVTSVVNIFIVFNNNYEKSFRIFSCIIFNPLALMTIITQLKSMFTSPGYVPIPFNPEIYKTNNLTNIDKHHVYCSKCDNRRPLRSHHCKICNKCTLKMDHHCPWVANCVGYYNQKNFYQFLFYGTFGDLIAFLLLSYISIFKVSFSFNYYLSKATKSIDLLYLFYLVREPIFVLVGLLCSFAMTISIGTLFYKQTLMLMNNQTTIDKKMFENWTLSPFYINNSKKCFNSVMGNSICQYFSLHFEGESPYFALTSSESNGSELKVISSEDQTAKNEKIDKKKYKELQEEN